MWLLDGMKALHTKMGEIRMVMPSNRASYESRDCGWFCGNKVI